MGPSDSEAKIALSKLLIARLYIINCRIVYIAGSMGIECTVQ